MKTLRCALRGLIVLLVTGALLLGANRPVAAQLADTVWPMFQHDPQHTGGSSLLGPLFPSGAPAPTDVTFWQGFNEIKSSPTIASDGTIYIALDWYLCAINPDMSEKWCTLLHAEASQSSAAIGIDGTVYLGDRDNSVTAFDPVTGVKKWVYNHGFEGDIYTSPTIALDGTIYVAFSQNFYGYGVVTALKPTTNPTGDLKWYYKIGKFMDASSPAIDQNGFLYLGDVSGAVYKLKKDGGPPPLSPVVWKAQVGTKITASPVIGADGTIYIGSTNGVSAIRSKPGPTGSGEVAEILWTFPTGIVDQTPALGSDGTVYFGAKSGQLKTIYAVARDGTLRWKYGPFPLYSSYGGFPIVGDDGVVYVGFGNGVYAFSPDGVLLWNYQTGNVVRSFPAIGGTATKDLDGPTVLYLPSSDFRLYKISSSRHGRALNVPPTAIAGPDQSGTVGRVLHFDGSSSTDPDNGDVISFTWNFGDGRSAVGARASHAYLTDGIYVVTLTVSDGLSAATDTLTVTVDRNLVPIPFNDEFDRSLLGNNWEVEQGEFVIGSNSELRNGASKNTHIAIVPALSGLSHSAAASFASVDNNAAPRLGVVLRFLDPENYYVFYRQIGGTSALRIARIANGVETILASVGTPPPALNTFYRISADATANKLTLTLCASSEASSSALVCSIKAQTLTATDSSNSALAGGSVGVLLGTGTSSTKQYRVDHFTGRAQ
jgi:outer membrane protein assembly factor BamB/PKD repeat protein